MNNPQRRVSERPRFILTTAILVLLATISIACKPEIGPARPVPPLFDDPDRVISELTDSITRGNRNPAIFLQCGKAYLQKAEMMRRKETSWYTVEIEFIEKAADLFTRGIVLDSTLVELHHQLGVTSHRLRNFPAAIDILSKAATLDSAKSQIFSDLGWAYFWRSENPYVASYNPDWYPKLLPWIEHAQKALETALQLDPGNATAHRRLGNVYYVQRRNSKAFEEYQIALKLGFSDPEDYLDLQHRYDNTAAEALLEKTPRWIPQVAALSIAPLVIFVDKNSVFGSRRVMLERAISLDTNNVLPLEGLIRLLEKIDLDQAIRYYLRLRNIDPSKPIHGLSESFYRRVAQHHPNDYRPYLDWGSIYMWQKRQTANLRTFDPESAAVLFRKVIELNPSKAAPYLHLWVLSLEKGDSTKASEYFEAAIRAADKSVWTSDILFRLSELERLDLAVQLVENFTAEAGEKSLAYNIIASHFQDKGDLLNAERYLLKSLSLHKNALIKQELAEIYTKKRAYNKAITLLEETLREPNPYQVGWTKWNIYVSIGKNYGHKRDMKKAAEAFQKAEQSAYESDDLPDVLLLIANAYKELGFKQQAKEYFQRAAALGSRFAQKELEGMDVDRPE